MYSRGESSPEKGAERKRGRPDGPDGMMEVKLCGGGREAGASGKRKNAEFILIHLKCVFKTN
jgi:hypothetical protein